MKRLCMLVFNYYDIDSRVKRQVRYALKRGWQVDVIALKSHYERKEEDAAQGFALYEIPVEKRRAGLFRYLWQYFAFCLLSFFLLSRLWFRKKYGLIQVHNLPDFLVFSALTPKLFGCRILLDMHEMTPEFFMYKYGAGEKSLLIRIQIWIERLSFAFADYVITVNDEIRDLFISRGLSPRKISTVYDSADEALFRRPEISGEPDTFVFLYHGTLTSLYGLETALEAVSLLPPEIRRRMVFEIAGDGPDEPGLRKMAQDLELGGSVVFLGSLPLERMPAIVGRCHAGICPTSDNVLTRYCLSTKLLEFIHMKKPVCVSALRTYRRYFGDGLLYYYRPARPQELADRMREIITGYGEACRKAERALEEYRPLCWSSVAPLYGDLLERIASGNAAGSAHKEKRNRRAAENGGSSPEKPDRR